MRWFSIALLLTLANPSLVAAHHTSHVSSSVAALENGRANADGTLSSWVRLDLESAAFERELSSGSWRSLTLAGAWAPLPWLAVTVNFPMSWLTFEESLGHSTNDLVQAGSVGAQHQKGLADMEVGILVRALRTDDGALTLLTGLSAELPTGAPENRLGTGHVEMLPSVELIAQLTERLSLSTEARYTFSLEGERHSHDAQETGERNPSSHGSLLTPHGEQEFITRMELDWFQDFGYLGAGAELVYGVHGPEGLQGIRAYGVVGVTLNERVLLTGGFTLPVNDVVREEWKMHLGLTFRFGAPTPESADCGCPDPIPTAEMPRPCACGSEPQTAPSTPSAPDCCPEGECTCAPKKATPDDCEECPGCGN